MEKILSGLLIFYCSFIFALEKEEPIKFSCSTPVLIKPIITHIRNSNKIKNNDLIAPKQCPTQKFLFNISRFIPDKTDTQYDKFFQIYYCEPRMEFRLFIKNNIVMKIEQINSNKTTTIYCQTIRNKINNINFKNQLYEKISKEILDKIYAAEPVFLRLNEGSNTAEISLTVDRDVDIGIIRFAQTNFEYRFCHYKGHLENAAFLINTPSRKNIVFSITLTKDIITFANIYDNNIKNGFDCSFYRNNGLKFYLPMKNGLFNNVFIWSENGIKQSIYPFNIWEKEGRPMSYMERK